MNEANAWAIGNMAGRYLDIDVDRNPLKKWKKFLRIKVAVNIHHRLLCGFFHETNTHDTVWIQFKYERLNDFCYSCGHLNHSSKDCPSPLLAPTPLNPRDTFGPWLRASNQNLDLPHPHPWHSGTPVTVARPDT